ncbi:expressed unknown protein [Seminavis robusta]|uniref:Secreted protein n=1 Tax=Seminavis robusta TaxID=568900 RepID=A0A9N8D5X1_9STRA|nr:expressed unknown protein [Seminavis robusta]|eukprot:Sro8_g006691.1  (119) ;mRNA; r:122175-122625
MNLAFGWFCLLDLRNVALWLPRCRAAASQQLLEMDGMLAPQAKTLLQRLASATASKTQFSYSQMMFFMQTRISIALVKATHLCLRGSRKAKPFAPRNGPQFLAPDPTEPSPEFRLFFA